jgi:DNA-binding CsgD family transcriptional regulator
VKAYVKPSSRRWTEAERHLAGTRARALLRLLARVTEHFVEGIAPAQSAEALGVHPRTVYRLRALLTLGQSARTAGAGVRSRTAPQVVVVEVCREQV